MKRLLCLASTLICLIVLFGCKRGDNYKVSYKVLRQNTQPAEGFRVEAWVKGKSEPTTLKTNAQGMAEFKGLPYPNSQYPLMTNLHYYNGEDDGARQITYPYLESDAKRLKDTHYIPNNSTPEPQTAKRLSELIQKSPVPMKNVNELRVSNHKGALRGGRKNPNP